MPPLLVRRCLALAALWLATAAMAATQAVTMQLPSLDAPGGQPVMLPGFWFAQPAADEPRTAVLLHGCGGPYGTAGPGGPLSRHLANYVDWLAGLGPIGWSHGGSAVLAATNLAHPAVAAAELSPAVAVAFYPGCSEERARGCRGSAPLLLLRGAADDWTPAAPCQAMAEAATAPKPLVVLF